MTDSAEPKLEPLRAAGFWIRSCAFVVDLALWVAVGVTIQGTAAPLWLFAAAYFPACWSFAAGGRTIGMRLTGLDLVSSTGGPVSLPRAIVRFIALVPSFGALLLGVLWIAFDARHQGWHDKLAGTFIVRGPTGASRLSHDAGETIDGAAAAALRGEPAPAATTPSATVPPLPVRLHLDEGRLLIGVALATLAIAMTGAGYLGLAFAGVAALTPRHQIWAAIALGLAGALAGWSVHRRSHEATVAPDDPAVGAGLARRLAGGRVLGALLAAALFVVYTLTAPPPTAATTTVRTPAATARVAPVVAGRTAPPTPHGSVTLRGSVRWNTTGLPGVSIVITGGRGDVVTTTDAAGRFVVAGIPAGTYAADVRSLPVGYVATTGPLRRDIAAGVSVELGTLFLLRAITGLSPVDGAVVPAPVTVKWAPVTEATAYFVEVREMGAPEPLFTKQISGLEAALPGLAPGRTYRWRVWGLTGSGPRFTDIAEGSGIFTVR